MALKKVLKKAVRVAKKKPAAKKAAKPALAVLRETIDNGFAEIERLLDGPHDDTEVEELVRDVHNRIRGELGDA